MEDKFNQNINSEKATTNALKNEKCQTRKQSLECQNKESRQLKKKNQNFQFIPSLNWKIIDEKINYECTCLLITGPRSALDSVPAFTLIALACSTSLSSLAKY